MLGWKLMLDVDLSVNLTRKYRGESQGPMSRSQVPHSPRPRNPCLVSLIFGIYKATCRGRESGVSTCPNVKRFSLFAPHRVSKSPQLRARMNHWVLTGFLDMSSKHKSFIWGHFIHAPADIANLLKPKYLKVNLKVSLLRYYNCSTSIRLIQITRVYIDPIFVL